jgi:saccharopepsin
MKSTSLLTASVLLGYASAAVHKLKLNKVPLDEQLVSDHESPSIIS